MKFKYYDKVKVADGFYVGMIGHVVNYQFDIQLRKYHYDVKIEKLIGTHLHTLEPLILEDYLEKI